MPTRRNLLRDWRGKATLPLWQSALGERVNKLERAMMTNALSRMHGETVLWIGHDCEAARVLTQKMIKLPVYLGPHLKPEQDATETAASDAPAIDTPALDDRLAYVGAEHDQLPFQSNSVDGVVLHHSLEEHKDPRLMLREISRVLAPGGHLVVCGFNPWSLIGLRRAYARIMPDLLSKRRLINPIRLFDWFTLLGFELDAPPQYGGLGLLFNREGAVDDAPPHQIPFGGLFLTSAVKQVNNYYFRFNQTKTHSQLAPVTYPRIASWSERKFAAPCFTASSSGPPDKPKF